MVLTLPTVVKSQEAISESWYPLDIGNRWSFYYGTYDTYVWDAVIIKVIDSLRFNSNLYFKMQINFYIDTNPSLVPDEIDSSKASDSLFTFERYNHNAKEIWAINQAIHHNDTLYHYWGPDSLFEAYSNGEVLITTFPDSDSSTTSLGIRWATFTDSTLSNPRKYYRYDNLLLDNNEYLELSVDSYVDSDLEYNPDSEYSYIKGIGLFILPHLYKMNDNSIEFHDFFDIYYYSAVLGGEQFEIFTSIENLSVVPSKIDLSTYPNPFNPSTTVEITTKKGAIYSIDLYNMLGQKLKTLHSGPLPSGRSTFELDGQGLASGIYIIRAVGGGEVISHKVVLMK